MDALKIEEAAKKIRELSAALEWLRSNGKRALPPGDREAFGITVSLNSCSALSGAKEAAAQLSACARWLSHDILEHAIRDAENTIEIYKQQIAKDLESETQ